MARRRNGLSLFFLLLALLAATEVRGDNAPATPGNNLDKEGKKTPANEAKLEQHKANPPTLNGNHQNQPAPNQNGNNLNQHAGVKPELEKGPKGPEGGNPNHKSEQHGDNKPNGNTKPNGNAKPNENGKPNAGDNKLTENTLKETKEKDKQAEANPKQPPAAARETDMGTQSVADDNAKNTAQNGDHIVISESEIKELSGKSEHGEENKGEDDAGYTPDDDDDNATKPTASGEGRELLPGGLRNGTIRRMHLTNVVDDVKFIMLSACVAVFGVAILVILATAMLTKRRRRPYERCRGFGDECELRSNFQLVNNDERLGIRNSANYFL